MNALNATGSHTLKWLIVNFMLYEFYLNLRKVPSFAETSACRLPRFYGKPGVISSRPHLHPSLPTSLPRVTITSEPGHSRMA